MSYYDKYGYLHAKDNVHNSENAILFTFMRDKLSRREYSIPCKLVDDFYINADPEKDHTPHKLSLDNMNAFCCVTDQGWTRSLLRRIPWYVQLRPDNAYTWFKCAGYPFLALPFLPLASAMMIYSCWKVNDKKPRGEGKHRSYISELATSGKLQVWTRLHAVRMPITKWICNKLINRSPWNGWKTVFKVYFEAHHPLLGYPKENYEP